MRKKWKKIHVKDNPFLTWWDLDECKFEYSTTTLLTWVWDVLLSLEIVLKIWVFNNYSLDWEGLEFMLTRGCEIQTTFGKFMVVLSWKWSFSPPWPLLPLLLWFFFFFLILFVKIKLASCEFAVRIKWTSNCMWLWLL